MKKIVLLYICTIFAQVASGTCPLEYDSLVLSGGGVRGSLYPGALTALEEAGILQGINAFAGTSAGSGTAAFLAIGLSATDIRAVLAETSLKDLVDYSLPQRLKRALFGIGTSHLVEILASRKGFFSGEKLQEQFDIVIQRKFCADYLGKLFSEIKPDSPELLGNCSHFKHVPFEALSNDVELRLTGFDITRGRLSWFDKKNTPKMPISLAIRISSGIPWMFEPAEWDGSLFVDGGMLRRIPVDAFSSKKMLALKISSDFTPTQPRDVSELSFIEYSRRIMRAAVQHSQDLDLIQRKKQEKGIDFVDFTENPIAKSQSALDFDISFAKRAVLVEVGYTVMQNHIRDKATLYGCVFSNANFSASPMWVAEMFQEAKTRDKQLANTFTKDFAIERNIFLFFAVTIVLTLLSGKLRNNLHYLFLKNCSGIQTDSCAACQRGWVPSELSYRKVNALSSGELKNALKSRGIVVGEVTISEKRRRLRQAVYAENISFRRPWSLLYHSDIIPCRWTTKDFPINEYVVATLALLYIFSMMTTIGSAVRSDL